MSQNLIWAQQNTANNILDKIHREYPTAFCAGGAPRDWYMKELAKDIDIYIPSSDNQTKMHKTLSELKVFEYEQEPMRSGAVDEEREQGNYALSGLKEVYEINTSSNIVQIITMDNILPYEIVKDFAATISMYIWYDGVIVPTFEGLLSLHSEVIGYNYSADRYTKKMMRRYPEYKSVEMSEFYEEACLKLTKNQLHQIMQDVLL